MKKLIFIALSFLFYTVSFAASLSVGYVPKASSGTIIVDSVIYQSLTGNVGVGTASPRAKFDIEGNVYLGGTLVDITLYTASAGSGDSKSLRISADGTIYAF